MPEPPIAHLKRIHRICFLFFIRRKALTVLQSLGGGGRLRPAWAEVNSGAHRDELMISSAL